MKLKDWLNDPFLNKLDDEYTYCGPAVLANNDNLSRKWQTFHFSTRMKLEGADYFCRQVIGFSSMPDNIGLPLLAHRLVKWNLDAFFFELVSAFDTVLQEINILFWADSALPMEEVTWNKIKGKIPSKLVQHIESGYQSDWFKRIRRYRSFATHHAYIPTIRSYGFDDEPLDFDECQQKLVYVSKDKKEHMTEEISTCKEYMKNMANFISHIWSIQEKESRTSNI